MFLLLLHFHFNFVRIHIYYIPFQTFLKKREYLICLYLIVQQINSFLQTYYHILCNITFKYRTTFPSNIYYLPLLFEYLCFVDCRTVSGPNPFAQCVFPFKHDGKTYWGCPIDPDDSRKRWCSTLVDRSSHHVSGRNEYGHCDVNCPIHTDRIRANRVSSSSELNSNRIDSNLPRVSKGTYEKSTWICLVFLISLNFSQY